MAYIRANFKSGTVTSTSDSTELATGQTKYWTSEAGVSDTIGVWDDVNRTFIPDGWHDVTTGWFWPEGHDWSNYNANN